MLQASIRAVAQKCGASSGTGAVVEVNPDHAAAQLQPLGLDEILVAPVGGPWTGCVEAVVATTELARWLVPLPYVGTTLTGGILMEATGTASKGVTALAIDASLARLELSPGATTATAWDTGGATAAVMIRREVDESIAVIRTALHHEQRGMKPIDLTRQACGAALDGSEVIGVLAGKDGSDFATRLLAMALTCIAADIVGTMEGGLAIANAYAISRQQFGKPIGSFQAIQHLLAEQHISLQAVRIATYFAAWSVQERGLGEALQAARVAKAFASEVGVNAAEALIQVHGGIGFTWEHVAHLFLRRAIYNRAALGDERVHYPAYLAQLRRNARDADDFGLIPGTDSPTVL
jgi:alkylation response protein AidB-like acyl-CoA dehydrogenase